MTLFRALNIFLTGGLLCGASLLLALLVAFAYAAVRERGSSRKWMFVLVLAGFALSGCGTLRLEVVPSTAGSGETPSATATRAQPASTRQRVANSDNMATATATRTPSVTPTSTPAGPTFSDAFFCPEPCADDGENARTVFSGGVEQLHARWRYEDVPADAHYERIWRSRGEEWVVYDCTWPGPAAGEDVITLTEPDGLRSGPWELIIRVEGEEVLHKAFTVTGDHEYWHPAGSFNTCYGKKPDESTPAPTRTPRPVPPRPTNTMVPQPSPTVTPSPTATPTPFPVAVDHFAVTEVRPLAEGKQITFAWFASGRDATIRGETAIALNPSWTIPLSGTLTVEVAESVYRNPDFVLEVSDGDPLSPTVASRTVQVEWPCEYAYFFESAPDLCPARSAVQTRIAYQPFERGHMVWRENLDDIFVFYGDGTWQRFPDVWSEESDEEIEDPPVGLYRPVRGFGLVWEQQVGVRERLGWGTAPESESSLTYQDQIPLSERLLPTYWRRAGADLLYLTSHGTLAGQWQAVSGRPPAASGGVLPR